MPEFDLDFITAYIPDFQGLRLEEAAEIAKKMDEEAAKNLEEDFLNS